jgi:uncharacterized protein (TIGR02611 family)
MHSFGTLMRFIWRSSKRAAVFVVGVALLTAGFIMFVTPGPGIVLVVAGLAVLATEFAWAEHLLDKAKEQAAKAGESAQRVPGVATVTAAAGRLIPRRWRSTTATSVVVSETTANGVVTARATAIASATITTITPDAAPPDTSVELSGGADPTDNAPPTHGAAPADSPVGDRPAAGLRQRHRRHDRYDRSR